MDYRKLCCKLQLLVGKGCPLHVSSRGGYHRLIVIATKVTVVAISFLLIVITVRTAACRRKSRVLTPAHAHNNGHAVARRGNRTLSPDAKIPHGPFLRPNDRRHGDPHC